MRFFVLSLFIVIGLNAGNVTLSALIGTVKADKKLVLGDRLQSDTDYTVGSNSKVQLLLNDTGVITVSQNSIFSIKAISDDAITLFFEKGIYKIVNLANQDQDLKLFINTPELMMEMTDTITLFKITSTDLKAACVATSFTVHHEDKTIIVKKNEMIVMENDSLKRVPLNYDNFYEVILRKEHVDLDEVHEESNMEDPTDLEN